MSTKATRQHKPVTKSINVHLPVALHDKLKLLAAADQRTIKSYTAVALSRLITHELAKVPKDAK